MNNSLKTATDQVWGKKPVQHHHIIMDAILHFVKIIDCQKNKKLNLMYSGKEVCYFLFEGYGAFCRSSDGLMLGNIRAPHIAGLNNIILPYADEYYIRPEKECIMMMASTEMVKKVIADNNLWESLAIILAYQSYEFSGVINRLTGRSSYELICNQIVALMDEPADIRLSITPAQYIMNKTLLSRSYVMKILAKLKSSQKITIENKALICASALINELSQR